MAFLPLNSVDGPYVTTGSNGTAGQITRFGSGNSFFAAPVNVPSGALITSIEFDYCDNNVSSNRSTLQLVETDYLGNVIAATAPISSVFGACDFVGADVSASGIVVDNNLHSCHLIFYHNIGDGSESIAGAIVGYQLQVSPAPLTATFNDVPTSDFAFQFIEAFNKAGITVGCNVSPPMFCPDRNVTRREMAVFFAKALGLQFQ